MRQDHSGSRTAFFKDPAKVFLALSALFLIILMVALTVTDGQAYHLFFFQDATYGGVDTGMDFFNSYAETEGGVPYTRYETLYPPLANLFFYILQGNMPSSFAQQIPHTHKGVVDLRNTSKDLRTRQEALVPFILYCIVITLLLCFAFETFLKKNVKYPRAVALACFFCYGNLYALERGNIILVALLLTVYFAMFYNSGNRFLSETALIALALAAGLKLVPAVYGFILVKEKKWSKAIRTVIYGILAFVLPFFAFEGFAAIPIFFQGLTQFSGDSGGVYGINGAMRMVFNGLEQLFGFRTSHEAVIILAVKVFALVSLVFCFVRNRKRSVNWLLLTLILTFFQESRDYNLCFFLIPFLFFLKDHTEIRINNLVEYLFYLVVTLPYLTPIVTGSKNLHTVMVILALGLITLYELILCIGQGRVDRESRRIAG